MVTRYGILLTVTPRDSLPDRCITNAPEQTIIITTNCEGAAGRGVAEAMRRKYPSVYKKYRRLCMEGIYHPNMLITADIGNGKQLLLFPTKIQWRKPSYVEMVCDNLYNLLDNIDVLNIESIATPSMGMENGWLKGKDKQRVIDTMTRVFEDAHVPATWYR